MPGGGKGGSKQKSSSKSEYGDYAMPYVKGGLRDVVSAYNQVTGTPREPIVSQDVGSQNLFGKSFGIPSREEPTIGPTANQQEAQGGGQGMSPNIMAILQEIMSNMQQDEGMENPGIPPQYRHYGGV